MSILNSHTIISKTATRSLTRYMNISMNGSRANILHLHRYCVLSNCAPPPTPFSNAMLDKCLPYDYSKPACHFPINPETGNDDPKYPPSGFTPKVRCRM